VCDGVPRRLFLQQTRYVPLFFLRPRMNFPLSPPPLLIARRAFKVLNILCSSTHDFLLSGFPFLPPERAVISVSRFDDDTAVSLCPSSRRQANPTFLLPHLFPNPDYILPFSRPSVRVSPRPFFDLIMPPSFPDRLLIRFASPIILFLFFP